MNLVGVSDPIDTIQLCERGKKKKTKKTLILCVEIGNCLTWPKKNPPKKVSNENLIY